MSDQDENSKQKPSSDTASVPLKKETIRVTLRANPDAEKPEAPKPAGAPTPPKPPGPPKAPAPPKPPAPAPAAASSAEPKPAAPAPTVKLNTPSKPMTPGGGSAPLKTVPLTGGATKSLPKATVNLQPTKPADAPSSDSQAQTTFSEDQSYELDSEPNNAIPIALSIIVLVISLGVFFLAYQTNQFTSDPIF